MGAKDKSPTSFLTAAQANHFIASLRQIDRLLCSIEEVVGGDRGALFPRAAPDLTRRQKELLLRFAAEMRKRMAEVMQSHGMAIPEARTKSSRAVESALTFIDIALSDLRPKVMRGYGEVSARAVAELDLIVAELQSVQGSAFREFHQGRGGEGTS